MNRNGALKELVIMKTGSTMIYFKVSTTPCLCPILENLKKRIHSQGFPNYPSMATNVFEIAKNTNGKPKQVKNNEIRPVLVSDHHKTSEKEIDLLYISDIKTDKSHYVLIKNLSRLFTTIEPHHASVDL